MTTTNPIPMTSYLRTFHYATTSDYKRALLSLQPSRIAPYTLLLALSLALSTLCPII